MGLFSFIETFFFVSLGITFILILLLVYHFRQRFTTLEQKCDTMFELINNIVTELNTVRNVQHGFHPEEENIIFHPETMMQHVDHIERLNRVEEEVETDNDEDSDSDSDSDSDESSGDESGDNEDIQDVNDDNSVKIISLENTNNVTLSELPDEMNYISENENDSNVEIHGLNDAEQVVVEKLENKHLENIDTIPNEEHSDDVYRKMNMQSLKTLVITKGLCSDPSKMKKNELLKMLESNDNM
jgi:hypothetical protein